MTPLSESELNTAENCSHRSPFLKWLFLEMQRRRKGGEKPEPKESWLKGMGLESRTKWP